MLKVRLLLSCILNSHLYWLLTTFSSCERIFVWMKNQWAKYSRTINLSICKSIYFQVIIYQNTASEKRLQTWSLQHLQHGEGSEIITKHKDLYLKNISFKKTKIVRNLKVQYFHILLKRLNKTDLIYKFVCFYGLWK